MIEMIEFEEVDREFGVLLFRSSDQTEPLLRLSAMLAMRAVRMGHSCLRLSEWADREVEELRLPPPEEWRRRLLGCPAVVSEQLERRTALVLRGDRLYLHKYLSFEQEVARAVQSRRGRIEPAYRPPLRAIHRNFTDQPENAAQQQAVQLALNHRFAVITGGPGTGKTTVVAAILALELARNPELEIALAAPTGKAKARLAEAIAGEVENLLLPERRLLADLEVKTLHRLLALRGEGSAPGYDREHPLVADLVVLDEASMVSLPLMARLCRALKPEARLLLLGDADQLSSIETGSVLADLCRSVDPEQVARLTFNYRARSNPELVDFCRRMVTPPVAAAELAGELFTAPSEHFRARPLPAAARLRQALSALLTRWGVPRPFRPATLEEAFALAEQWKILAPVREGLYGVENLNLLLGELLDLSPRSDGAPVLIGRNDRRTGLNNGDVGTVWRGRVYFRNPDGAALDSCFHFAPEELPEHEPVFAMSVHKAQGSGFDRVLLVLDTDRPVQTRELVYTGITRTRRSFELWSTPEVLAAALDRPTRRCSGLAEELATP